MATDPGSLNTAPQQPAIPEDDATLQAIEALEVKSNALDQPFRPTQRVAERPVIKPVVAPTPVVVRVAPPKPVIKPTIPNVAPVVIKLPIHKKPAEEMAEELANAPAVSPEDAAFQPFPRRKPSKKPLFIGFAVIVLILLIVGGIFGMQVLQK